MVRLVERSRMEAGSEMCLDGLQWSVLVVWWFETWWIVDEKCWLCTLRPAGRWG